MNKIQTKGHTNHHKQHHEDDDDCDDCQKERQENNMLVNFYERLNNIENKVGRIKSTVTNQQQKREDHQLKIELMAKMLKNKPEQSLKLIKMHDSKEMGYELASALVQRQIKTKHQNQRLQAIIDQLQKQKSTLQQQKKLYLSQQVQPNKNITKIISITQKQVPNHSSRYSDVIDEVRNTNDSSFLVKNRQKQTRNSYFLDMNSKQYWEEASIGQDQTNFSSFTAPLTKQKNKTDKPNQYAGLNLWLYQFKPQQMDETPIKSLRKPPNIKNKDRYKSKF